MSYDLSFDRKTATLLALCAAAIVLLLVAAGFLLGAQLRRPAQSAVVVPEKKPLVPAVKKIQPAPAAIAAPALVETSAPSVAKPDSVSSAPAIPPASPLAAAKDVDASINAPAITGYNLQFGAFREEANAEAAVKQLKEKKVKAEVIPRDDAAGDTWYTVRFGDYPTLSAAAAAAVPLRASTQRSIFVRPSNRP